MKAKVRERGGEGIERMMVRKMVDNEDVKGGDKDGLRLGSYLHVYPLLTTSEESRGKH